MINFVSSPISKRYKVYVTWVDHGTYVKDARVTPALSNFSLEVSRNFHITGFRLDGEGGSFKYNVIIPQEIQGSFKVPQIGDVIVVEEEPRYLGQSPVYLYSIYNDVPYTESSAANIPNWGSIPGDYGHLRSHTDHNLKFNAGETSFTRRYIKSITGYRFRKFYGHVYDTKDRFLEEGKFVVRGDVVFDIEDTDAMSKDEIESEGVNIVSTKDNQLSDDLSSYPNPLNVPFLRATDERFSYSSHVPRYLPEQVEADPYKGASNNTNPAVNEFYVNVFKNKNYFSYTPIMDKKYNDYLIAVSAGWDPSSGDSPPEPILRELPAAEEYQVALRGNNKLLIQDQYGNGEQLLITLKNQYDSGFTIIHNADTSQVRVRDHLGQGVLLEGDPEHPRVVAWTTERQVLDMGSIREYDYETGETKSFGEYFYLRNGSVYGKSDTNFGRITANEIPRDGNEDFPVPQQDFILVSSKSSEDFSNLLDGISSRLSSGMSTMLSDSPGSGFYFRNNPDPKDSNQFFSIYNNFDEVPVLTTKIKQEHKSGLNEKNITTEFIHTVTDTYSEIKQIGDYDNLSRSEHISKNDSFTSETIETNLFVDSSEIKSVRKAKMDGVAEELKTFNDFIGFTEIEVLHRTDTPVTKTTQRKNGNTLNTHEAVINSVTTTQYINGDPATIIKQEEDRISLTRVVSDVVINIGSQDKGEGVINIGSVDDVINIGSGSSSVNIKSDGILSIGSSSEVSITAPLVNVNEGDGG